ncbi:MAG: toll/interleukin-1 receptor domain-containing protein [Nocardioides sp.]
MSAIPSTKLFQSWCHEDADLVGRLSQDLTRALALSNTGDFAWWQDSHLHPGEDLTSEVVARLEEAAYAAAMVSPGFLASHFIRTEELPRFTGPRARIGVIPVLVRRIPGFGPEWNLGGLNGKVFFTAPAGRAGRARSYEELRTSAERLTFAQELARKIVGRANGGDYRPLAS